MDGVLVRDYGAEHADLIETGWKVLNSGLKIAYLTNVYPAVSHSFIRREILAIEAMGHPVARWSVRRAAPDLPDPADRAERDKTAVLLDNPFVICAAAVAALFRSPLTARQAIQAATSGRAGGIRPLVARLAHFAEGCYLARKLRATNIDHLHVHFGTNPAAVARVARIMGGPPYSFTAHGPDEFDQPEAIGLGGKVTDAAFAVAISDYGRSQLMRWSPVDAWPRIKVVRCGVDETFLAAEAQENDGPRSAQLCCIARLAPQKGLPLLIEAARLLLAENISFDLVIVGDGPLRADLERRIAEAALTERVRLIGWADAASVRRIIETSRAMVLPSFAEGLPVVIMEALALGRPVITTAIAGIPELVDSGCGWIIPAGSAEALAEAMREALSADAAVLETMGCEGARRVRARHDAAINTEQLLRHIEAAHQDQPS